MSLGTILVTGASGGIGYEIAKRLAPRADRFILTARSADRLAAVGAELQSLGARAVDVVPADLAAAAGAPALLAAVEARGHAVDVLVNNAGFGAAGSVAELDLAMQLEMIQLNVTSLVALTRGLLPGMLARRRGQILNVASVAGFQPGPYMAVYYATKAFVVSFSEALESELRGTGITVQTFCPGPTRTGFAARAGAESGALFRQPGVMDVGPVADAAVAALERGGTVVPGFQNKLLIQSQRIAPRRMVRGIVERLNRVRSGAA